MKNAGFLKSVVILGIVAFVAYAADYPFSDNFSDSNQTKKNWALTMGAPKDSILKPCVNGVLKVTNIQKGTSALVYHEFLISKTPVFTASCTIKRSSDAITAGMFLCLTFPASTGPLSGYSILIKNGYVSFNKNGPSAGPLWGAPFRSLLTDELKISKLGNSFNIFCNGVFLGSCTDNNAIASGDFGLIVQPNAEAEFDDVLFTDKSTEGGFPACITDNFSDKSVHPRWQLDYPKGFAENDSVLVIDAPVTDQALCFARAAVGDTFAARLIVSNHSGDSNAFYGLMLYGFRKETKDTMQILSFGITGTQTGKAYLPNVSFSPIYKPQIINGSVFRLNDTIDAIKAKGSNVIKMYVNGYPLDSMPLSSVKFDIAGAGIFNTGGVKVSVDNFFIGPGLGGCPGSKIKNTAKMVSKPVFNPSAAQYLVNPLGRKVYALEYYSSSPRSRAVPGYYISKNGKSRVVIKNR